MRLTTDSLQEAHEFRSEQHDCGKNVTLPPEFMVINRRDRDKRTLRIALFGR
jgi:hypothetical protein